MRNAVDVGWGAVELLQLFCFLSETDARKSIQGAFISLRVHLVLKRLAPSAFWCPPRQRPGSSAVPYLHHRLSLYVQH